MTDPKGLIQRMNGFNAGNQLTFPLFFLILLAIVVSVINALKPVHIDDTYYLWVARQILSEPSNPFGFEIFWQQWPMMAHEGYVPPLVPYWLALSLSMVGDNPFLLKLSMFPFVFLFVVATYLLGRRFAPSIALPLTAFLSFSPGILPSWNMMLDLPSIALSLIALEMFIRSTDRQKDSGKFAFAAGFFAAMAVLTKFTALVAPGVMLLYGLLKKRLLLGVGTGLLVLVLLIFWEYFHFLRYGHTQLFWSVMQGANSGFELGNVSSLSKSALLTIGALCPFLISVYFPIRAINKTFIGMLLISLTLVIGGYIIGISLGRLELLFSILGGALFVVIAVGVIVEIRAATGSFKIGKTSSQIFLFLFGWLILETLGYFLMSPLPAVRRLLVLTIVLTFLGFRNLDKRLTTETKQVGLVCCWILVTANLVLSSLYVGVDIKEANAQKALVSQAADRISRADQDASIWYAGHWGFAYYAEKAGMKPVMPETSLLLAGDWLVIPDRVHSQQLSIDWNLFTGVEILEAQDRIPVHTLTSFYSGQKPLRIKEGKTRLRLLIFRITREHVAKTGWGLVQIIQYIHAQPKRESTLRALPALLNFRGDARADIRKLVVETVASLNTLAVDTAPLIADMTTDLDPSVRVAVLEAFAKLGSRDPVVIAAIEARIDDPVAEVRFAAQAALTELTEQNSL